MGSVTLLRGFTLDHLQCPRRPGQADRRDPVDGIDPAAVSGAVARPLAGAQRPLPANLQMGVLAVSDPRDRAWLCRQAAAPGLGRHAGAMGGLLLLPALPGAESADRQSGNAAA